MITALLIACVAYVACLLLKFLDSVCEELSVLHDRIDAPIGDEVMTR